MKDIPARESDDFEGQAAGSSRTQARRRAVELLFEVEQRGGDVEETLQQRQAGVGDPVPSYAAQLVRGVLAHDERIKDLLSTYSLGWTLDRMPAVDRQALRIGVYELLWEDETPDEVAVSEAVTLVRRLSTDRSPAFVNGLLGRIKDLKPGLIDD